MSSRRLLWVSLAANVILAGGTLMLAHQTGLHFSRRPPRVAPPSPQIKTNFVVRRQFFSWQEVESDDYRTYIANLRAINCPEQTIRDIIIADVNALYARKRASEILTPGQQWWRSEPETNLVQRALARMRDLDQERRALLTRLLGPNWEPGDLVNVPRPSHPGVQLDGPVLGTLPNDIKKLVQEISDRSQDRVQAYLQAQRDAGKPLDPAELARLRQQTRNDLAGILSPQQLEEFLLRYSQTATDLRNKLGQLKFFNATADEFRAIFRAVDPLDMQIQSLAAAKDANSAAEIKALENRRENALRIALGPDRYRQYQLLQDSGYRDAYAAALEAGAPESAQTLYQINQATAQEQARIRANTNLTPEQLAYELKKVELEQLRAAAAAVGQELPPEPTPAPPEPPPTVHVVRQGEGLNFLAQLYGVSPNALREANPDLDFNKLKAGDSVVIPIALLPMVPVPTLPQ